MRRAFALFLLSLNLGLPPAARAEVQTPCNLGTLKGRYVFTARGFIEAVQPGIPRVHYGFFEFDGAGKITGRQSSSRGVKIGRENLKGVYTVSADCSGGTITL